MCACAHVYQTLCGVSVVDLQWLVEVLDSSQMQLSASSISQWPSFCAWKAFIAAVISIVMFSQRKLWPR